MAGEAGVVAVVMGEGDSQPAKLPNLESPHVVYKYRLKPAENLIEMPTGARLLHVDSQGSRAYVWALVNSKERTVRRKIAVVPTGLDFTTDCPIEHVGTFKNVEPDGEMGTMIFHAFDCGERENDAPSSPSHGPSREG